MVHQPHPKADLEAPQLAQRRDEADVVTPRTVVTDLPSHLPLLAGEADAVLHAIVDDLRWILTGATP